MSELDLEKQKVSLGTVVKWMSVVVTMTVVVMGALFKVDAMTAKAGELESRVHNLEEKVVWRK